MSLRERTLIVDIMTQKYQQPLFKQGDHLINMHVKVLENGLNANLTAYTAKCFFDNGVDVIQKDCTKQDNVITVVLDNAILKYAGFVKAEFVLSAQSQDGIDVELVTTFTILLRVEESIDRNSAVTKQPQWDILVDLQRELEEQIELIPNWLYGSKPPTADMGDKNDYYLQRENGEVHYRDKVTNQWKSTNIFLMGHKWHYGDGVPADTVGNNGDYYINTTNYDVYNKQNGKWVHIGNLNVGEREIITQDTQPTNQRDGHVWIHLGGISTEGSGQGASQGGGTTYVKEIEMSNSQPVGQTEDNVWIDTNV